MAEVKVQGSVHPLSMALPFLEYGYLKIWPWKSEVKVIDEVTGQSYKAGITSFLLTFLSFRANQPSHSPDTAFSIRDLENPRSRS